MLTVYLGFSVTESGQTSLFATHAINDSVSTQIIYLKAPTLITSKMQQGREECWDPVE
jgi:hypothetical protein